MTKKLSNYSEMRLRTIAKEIKLTNSINTGTLHSHTGMKENTLEDHVVVDTKDWKLAREALKLLKYKFDDGE